MVEVKKGGRVEYTCAGCQEVIKAKEPHLRGGGKPFKRYHKGCEPPKGNPEPVAEPKTEKKKK